MIDVTIKSRGIFALAMQSRSQREQQLGRVVAECLGRAIYDWATGALKAAKLADRVGPNAFALYGFLHRSQKYRQRQRDVLGRERAYFSPRTRNFAKLAVALTKRNPQALIRAAQDLLQRQAHLAELVTKPGVGFQIKMAGSKANPRVVVTLPGARSLNRGASAASKTYRAQMLDLSMGGGRDVKAILQRAGELYNKVLHTITPTGLLRAV